MYKSVHPYPAMQDAENFGLPFGLLDECKKEADKRYRKLIPIFFDRLEEFVLAHWAKALKEPDNAPEVDSGAKVVDEAPQEASCIQEPEEIPNSSAGFSYERRERE